MAEVGVLGLALQLYVCCTHSYKFFLLVRDYKRDSSVLTIKMRIEEIRFESWRSLWGFTDGMIEAKLAQEEPAMAVILKTLDRIKAIFEDTAGLVTKDGLEQKFKDMELDELLAHSAPECKQKWTARFLSIVRTGSTVIERCW
jgi:hypothetical protein